MAFPAGAELPCPFCNGNIVVPRALVGPGVTVGGFKLEKLLGKGGMGEVYLATQLSMHRQVALKILPASFALHKENVERFLQEVKMAARLKHPNIVRAYEAGEDNGVYYLAMDFVEGTAIDECLREKGAMPERGVRLIAEKLGRALEQIWEKHRMIHRDIKPANIMLDEYGEPLLMDMGLSKALDDGEGLTVSNTIMGSPNYMSPEQCDGAADLDFRTDMYSLGATFYHMLTGRVPFNGNSAMDVLRKQATEALPDPRNHNPDISEGFVRIIERMMAKRAKDRYPSWQDFLKELESLVFGAEQVASEPPSVVDTEERMDSAHPPADEYAELGEPLAAESGRSKKLVFISVSAALVVLIIVGIFLATRQGNDAPLAPSTAQQDGSPAMRTRPLVEAEIDLLALIDPRRNFADPNFKIENGKLVSPPHNRKIGYSLVSIPLKPVPDEYDVHMQIERRKDEGMSCNFIFVMGGRQGIVTMDGTSNPVWAVDRIDGWDLRSPQNPTVVGGQRLHPQKTVDVSIKVRTNNVSVFVDGKRIIHWTGTPTQLSLWDKLVLTDSSALYFYTQAEFIIHKMTITPR